MDGKNKRKYVRVEVEKGILLEEDFELVDLSESGMQLSSPYSRKTGNTLQFTLSLNGKNVYVNAIVRWCEQSKSIFTDNYSMGLQFVGMSVNQTLIVRKYMQRLLDDEDVA